jgi:predicted nucleic acid-binding protein
VAVYVMDSSALVKRYVRERGTAWVRSLTDPAVGHTLYIAGITGVEVVSALTRQTRSGALASTDAAQALTQFRHDFTHQYQTVDLTPPLIAHAMALAETYALRGYDAVQCAVAVALHRARHVRGLPMLTLVSADAALNTAAAAEGLQIDDPHAHP